MLWRRTAAALGRVVLRLGPAIVPATLAAAVLLAVPANGLAAEPKPNMDLLWNEFPLESAPGVERLDSRRAARLQSGTASVGGDSNELPLGVLLALAAAAAGVALVVKAAGTHVVQEHVSAGLDRLGTRGVPHVPRPRVPELHLPRVRLPELHLPRVRLPELHLPHVRLPELHLPRPEVPRLHLPRLPSNRVVQQLAETLDRIRQTVWHADVLFWTTAMAAAASFGVLIAFFLGGP